MQSNIPWDFAATSPHRSYPSTTTTLNEPWITKSWQSTTVLFTLTTNYGYSTVGISSASIGALIFGTFVSFCLILTCCSIFGGCSTCIRRCRSKRRCQSDSRTTALSNRLPAATVFTIAGNEMESNSETRRRGTDNATFEDLPPSYNDAVIMHCISITIADDLPSYEAAVQSTSRSEVNSINTQTTGTCRTVPRTEESHII